MGKRGHNEGTICKRDDGRWVGAVSLGYGPDGKRLRKTVTGRTRREVQEQVQRLLQEHDQGLPVATGAADCRSSF